MADAPVVRITIEDLATGKTEVQEVEDNDYFVLTTGSCEVAYTQTFPITGTHILTIKGRRGRQ